LGTTQKTENFEKLQKLALKTTTPRGRFLTRFKVVNFGATCELAQFKASNKCRFATNSELANSELEID
jgi:hypothetical protein